MLLPEQILLFLDKLQLEEEVDQDQVQVEQTANQEDQAEAQFMVTEPEDQEQQVKEIQGVEVPMDELRIPMVVAVVVLVVQVLMVRQIQVVQVELVYLYHLMDQQHFMPAEVLVEQIQLMVRELQDQVVAEELEEIKVDQALLVPQT